MIILPKNAAELVLMARDLGADVLKGHLGYPSETGTDFLQPAMVLEHLNSETAGASALQLTS